MPRLAWRPSFAWGLFYVRIVATTRGSGGAPPKRKLRVMFLGAGASKAAGLPLTEVLQRIWPRDHEVVSPWEARRRKPTWKRDLQRAVTVLYPDGGADGFRPPVSEFFTLLEVIDRVHSGRERMPLSTEDLLRDLRGEISTGLARACAELVRRMAQTPHYAWFRSSARPHVVITSNWDTLAEQAAMKAGLTVHLGWPTKGNGERKAGPLTSGEVVVLKLHGSTDWGLATDEVCVANTPPWKYDRLDAPISPGRHSRTTSISGGEELVRYRAIDAPVTTDRVAEGFKEPLMATMAAGKDYFIRGAIATIWDDAYWTLSRARTLDIVGYSFPDDDLELRTLLRLTTRKPGDSALADGLELSICNPSPDTHDRARARLGAGLTSSYLGAGSWMP